jgi:hypothetical protein
MAYFIGSDRELPPTTPWNEQHPAFYVEDAEPDELERVRKNLNFPYIRYAGAFTGCGCGFRSISEGADQATTEDPVAAQSDHESLARYLSSLPTGAIIQLFGCWSGDETEPPLHRRTVSPADFAAPDFAFRERELITVMA